MDDLSVWPLPRDVAKLARLAQKNASVFHLLSAISGAPGKLGGDGYQPAAPRAAAIVVFAAAHLLSEGEPWPTANWLQPDLRSASLSGLTERSLRRPIVRCRSARVSRRCGSAR